MKIIDRVQRLLSGDHKIDMSTDNLDKLIYMAYWIGREQATRDTSDVYSAHLAEQTKRAKACRYHKMATEILQNGKGYICLPDYSRDLTETFGNDETIL